MTSIIGPHVPGRVLVTGGAGFIGSHVADRFLTEGCDVTVVDDLSAGNKERVPERARFIEMDVRDAGLDGVVAEGEFDLVLHLAAQADVRVSVTDPQVDAGTNVLGLLNLLEACRRHLVKRFVFSSSGGVLYGEADTLPTPEDAPHRPESPYGVSKLAGEHYVRCHADLYGIATTCLRYGNVFGPRQNPAGEAGVVAIFGGRILAGRPITIFGGGEQRRDYVFVGDVVEANWLAATRSLPVVASRRAWNIGTGRGTSVNELADRLMAAAGRQVERIAAPARSGELENSVLDASRAALDLGWEPRADLDAGLRATLESLSENPVGEVV